MDYTLRSQRHFLLSYQKFFLKFIDLSRHKWQDLLKDPYISFNPHDLLIRQELRSDSVTSPISGSQN